MKQAMGTVPVMHLAVEDCGPVLSSLERYRGLYVSEFRRREQRMAAGSYLTGVLSAAENKAIEPMVLETGGVDQNEVRAMQHFISEGAWDDEAILAIHQGEVQKDLGDQEGVYLIDGCDFPKQGTHSAGVKRQYCGELGKKANCQAGVFLGYVSPKGYTLLNRRLYLPEDWLSEAGFAERRRKCGIPTGLAFKTKPRLALEMLDSAVGRNTLQARWCCADEGYGSSEDFRDGVASLGLWYFVEVPHVTMLWRERPRTAIKTRKEGAGRPPSVVRLVSGQPKAERAEALAAGLPAHAWSHAVIKEGTKGPIEADFAMLRVVATRDHRPGPEVWLIFRRTSNELKVFLSNAPASSSQETLIRMCGMRWPIEICFENGKQLLGMGDYQVRSWIGWQHHMTFIILAHFFLVRLKLEMKERAPALSLPQTYLLMKSILPKPEFDPALALRIIEYRQERNHAAHLSHRKRRKRKKHRK